MNKDGTMIKVFKGALLGYILTFLLFLLFSILLTYTDLDEANISRIVLICVIVSSLVSGFYVARKIKGKGWLIGATTAGIYAIAIIILVYIATRTIVFDQNTIKFIVTCLIAGTIGGIIGVNT